MTTQDYGKVGILYGGVSSEREVSLKSGQAVFEALRDAGVDAHLFDTGRSSMAELIDQNFDCVINVLHGAYGEDGCIQGMLELLGLPYACSGVTASAVALDKILTKRIMVEEGIPTPRYRIVRNIDDLKEALDVLGYPLILKPPHEGSTLGLQIIENDKTLQEQLNTVQQYESTLLAEEFIKGRELTVSVLGSPEQPQALPVIEIIAPNGKYDYENKYHSNETRYVCPAELPQDVADELSRLSVQLYQVLGCEGWARVDILLDAANKPYVLEINTNPGMTDHSLVPKAAAAAGISFSDLCLRVLSEARCKIHSSPATKG